MNSVLRMFITQSIGALLAYLGLYLGEEWARNLLMLWLIYMCLVYLVVIPCSFVFYVCKEKEEFKTKIGPDLKNVFKRKWVSNWSTVFVIGLGSFLFAYGWFFTALVYFFCYILAIIGLETIKSTIKSTEGEN